MLRPIRPTSVSPTDGRAWLSSLTRIFQGRPKDGRRDWPPGSNGSRRARSARQIRRTPRNFGTVESTLDSSAPLAEGAPTPSEVTGRFATGHTAA
jgi:hypothetical protein